MHYKAETWHAWLQEQYFSKHHFLDICQCASKNRNLSYTFILTKQKSPKLVLFFQKKSCIWFLAKKTFVTLYSCSSFIFLFPYSTSFCFSSSAKFLYRLSPYSHFLFCSSSERYWYLLQPLFFFISWWSIFRHFYIQEKILIKK